MADQQPQDAPDASKIPEDDDPEPFPEIDRMIDQSFALAERLQQQHAGDPKRLRELRHELDYWAGCLLAAAGHDERDTYHLINVVLPAFDDDRAERNRRIPTE